MRPVLNGDIIAGDADALTFIIKDQPGPAGKPISLLGMTGKYFMSTAPGGQRVLTKNPGAGGVSITDPVNGIVTVYLSPSDTGGLLTGTPKKTTVFYHELEMTDEFGPHTVHEGYLKVKPKTVA